MGWLVINIERIRMRPPVERKNGHTNKGVVSKPLPSKLLSLPSTELHIDKKIERVIVKNGQVGDLRTNNGNGS